MKIFALETDSQKLIRSILSEYEELLVKVRFSPFLFIIRSVVSLFLTLVFVAVGVLITYVGFPVLWVASTLAVVWLIVVGVRWITAFIDWRYDVLLVTTEEVVIVNQSSLFHVSIRQMGLENIASVAAETQFANLLPFGKLHFDLKEGVGKQLQLPYIPEAQRVASVISNSIVLYQRRHMERPAGEAGDAN